MSEVWAKAKVGSQGELLVLLALADWANDQGICWPSIPKIADKSRLSERQVRRILRLLAEKGTIAIEENRGRNNTNRYKLNLTVCPVLIELKPVIGDIENLTFETQNRTSMTVKPDIAMSAEPSRTTKEPPIEPPAALPTWLPLEPWNEFLKMRRRVKKPATEYAQKLLISDLEKLRASGQDPGKVLDQSIQHSWQGIFPLRKSNGKTDLKALYAEDED
jgi:hypothetical protein